MADFETLKAIAEQLEEPKKTNALALLAEMQTVVIGMDDSESRWRPSTLRIIQAMTDTDNIDGGGKKAPGQLVIGSTAIEEEKLGIHLLRTWDSRKMWDPDQTVTKIVCQSPDAKKGWRYGDCKTCEHSKWGEDRKPSPCKTEKSFLAVTADFRNVIEINFKGMSYKIGDELHKLLKKSTKAPYLREYSLGSVRDAVKKAIYLPQVLRTEAFSEGVEDQFLEELFMFFREERSKYITHFYNSIDEYAKRKAAQDTEDDDPAIIVRSSGDDVVEEGGETPNYTL